MIKKFNIVKYFKTNKYINTTKNSSKAVHLHVLPPITQLEHFVDDLKFEIQAIS